MNKGHPATRSNVRVLIEANKLQEPFMDGIRRYTEGLLHALPSHIPEGWEVDVFVDGKVYSLEEALARSFTASIIRRKFSRLARSIGKSILSETLYAALAHKRKAFLRYKSRIRNKRYLKHGKPSKAYDIVHALLPQHLPDLHEIPGKRVCTVHDLTHIAVAETHEFRNRELASQGMLDACSANAGIIAVSQHTASDIQKHYPTLGKNLQVVYEGVDRELFRPVRDPGMLEIVRKKYKIPPEPCFLCLGTIEPRKNITAAIRAYKSFRESLDTRCNLIITGRKGWKEKLAQERPHPKGKIILTGFVEDIYIPALYSMANAFVYPSLYEGFGLPVLEAMACGCPVVASNNSSLPEVVENAGILVNPTSVNEISQAMDRLFKNGFLPGTREAALKQSKKFSWEQCAQETVGFYQKLA